MLPRQLSSQSRRGGFPWRWLLMAMLLGNGRREGVAEAFAKSAARSLGSSVMRGLLGSILKR